MVATVNAKEFSTLAILGATTGVVLEDNGFLAIHDVFDFFEPGIGDHGMVKMMPKVIEEIYRQQPKLKQIVDEFGDRDQIVNRIDEFIALVQSSLVPVMGLRQDSLLTEDDDDFLTSLENLLRE